jgi:hypothetical protein
MRRARALSRDRADDARGGPPRWLRWGVGGVLALLVLGLLLRQIAADWGELDSLRDQLRWRPWPLAWAWLIQTAGWLLVVRLWSSILDQAGHRASYRVHLRIYALTALAHVLPGSVWAPAGRVALYRREGARMLSVGAAVLVEWILLGVAGLVLYGLSAPWSAAAPPAGAWWLVVVAALALSALHPRALGGAMRLAARVAGRGQAVPDGATAAVFPPRKVAVWLLGELTVLAASGFGFFYLMQAIAPRAGLADAMSAWAFTVALANLLAWLPLTSLVKDGGMVLLLAPFYGSSLMAAGVVLAWRIWMTLVQLSWAGIGAGLLPLSRGKSPRSGAMVEPDPGPFD